MPDDFETPTDLTDPQYRRMFYIGLAAIFAIVALFGDIWVATGLVGLIALFGWLSN